MAPISRFTHPANAFATPYRVINWHACNGGRNDPKLRFDHKDFLWCPCHAGTPAQVRRTIERIPGFGRHAAAPDSIAHASR